MNLQDFLDSVSTETGLDISASTASTAEINLITGYVNRGVVDLLRKTRCNVDVDDMTLTANQGDYDISQSVLEVLSFDLIRADGAVGAGLRKTTLDDIIEKRRMTQVVTSPYLFAFSGANLISFFPTPTGADTATMYYVPRPVPLSNPTDDPSDPNYGGIPPEFHDAIEYYAFYRAANYDDDDAGAQNYWKMYQGRMREIRREIQRMGGSKLPLMTTRSRYGRGRRNFGYHPSQDVWGLR